MNTHIGRWGATLPPDSAGDVPSSCSLWEKGGGMNDPLRPPAKPSVFEPTGGRLCCPISWTLNQYRRDLGSLLSGLQTEKVAWISVVWTKTARHISQGHSVLFEKLPEVERGWATRGGSGHTPNVKQGPMGREGGTSAEIQLAKAWEAHWKALDTTITLEEKIEWLSWSITRQCPGTHAPSWSWDWWRRRSWGQSRRHHKALPGSSLALTLAHSTPLWEDEEVEFDLGPPPELGPNVKQFFQRLAGKCEEDAGGYFPTEPPAEEHEKWVEWRGQAVDIPNWWQELEMITDVDDVQDAQKIWASFELLQWMSEVHNIENYYLAPLAPHCLYQKDFLSLPDLRFPCWDLWEEQQKKTIAYTEALQCWAERANLPVPGQPCLLAGSFLELCKMIECYFLFSDDIVLGSVALPEGFFGSESDLCFHRCPTHLHWCSIQRCSCTHWRAPWGVQPALGATWEVSEDGGSPKLIPQLGEGVTLLSASCCSGTSPTSLWGNETKAPPPELWGVESLMPKGRRAIASRAGQTRFTLTRVSWTNTHGSTTPRLWGGNSLPVRGPITCGHSQGAPGVHAARSSHWTCSGYDVC